MDELVRIGIGVTSNDPNKWHETGKPFSGFQCSRIGTSITSDYCDDQISVSHDKNKLINSFYDKKYPADYIFIFDDDCFPIREYWADFFINASRSTGIDHFVLCKPDHNVLIEKQPIVSLYQTGTGCMMFLTRKCIEKVGYINSAYGKYGYEHAGYSWRIHRAGLTPSWYVSVNGWEKFIYSWDLDKEGADKNNFVRAHWYGEENKADFILQNEDVFNKEIGSPKIYYPYDLEMSYKLV